jgi:hypothetical protein
MYCVQHHRAFLTRVPGPTGTMCFAGCPSPPCRDETSDLMPTFAPRLDILPEPQRKLWPELAAVPRRFVLYGGTAIVLRLGHRASVDFDFFSSIPFTPAGVRPDQPRRVTHRRQTPRNGRRQNPGARRRLALRTWRLRPGAVYFAS